MDGGGRGPDEERKAVDAELERLHPSMQECLQKLVGRVPGLQAILVSNQYGLPLIKARNPDADETIATAGIDSLFSTVFAMAAEQSEKLMFGATKTCVSCFEDVTLMHVAHYPLVITFVASSTANLGMMAHIVPQLKRALGPVQVKAEAELG